MEKPLNFYNRFRIVSVSTL